MRCRIAHFPHLFLRAFCHVHDYNYVSICVIRKLLANYMKKSSHWKFATMCQLWKLATLPERKINNCNVFREGVLRKYFRRFEALGVCEKVSKYIYMCVCVILRFMHFIRIEVKQQATSARRETRMQLFAYLANFQVKQIAKGTTK